MPNINKKKKKKGKTTHRIRKKKRTPNSVANIFLWPQINQSLRFDVYLFVYLLVLG
jgi:hypothetical protein